MASRLTETKCWMPVAIPWCQILTFREPGHSSTNPSTAVSFQTTTRGNLNTGCFRCSSGRVVLSFLLRVQSHFEERRHVSHCSPTSLQRNMLDSSCCSPFGRADYLRPDFTPVHTLYLKLVCPNLKMFNGCDYLSMNKHFEVFFVVKLHFKLTELQRTCSILKTNQI